MRKIVFFSILFLCSCQSSQDFIILEEDFTQPISQKEWNHTHDLQERENFPYPARCEYDPQGLYCIPTWSWMMGSRISYKVLFQYSLEKEKKALQAIQHYMLHNAFAVLLKKSIKHLNTVFKKDEPVSWFMYYGKQVQEYISYSFIQKTEKLKQAKKIPYHQLRKKHQKLIYHPIYAGFYRSAKKYEQDFF